MDSENLKHLALTLNSLAPLIWGLAWLSPIAASFCAAFFYGRHRRGWPDRERRVPVGVYVFLLLVSAVVGFPIGMYLGMQWGCSLPYQGNLCGLWGVFAGGPFASGLAIFLVGGFVALLPADVEPVPVSRTWTVSSAFLKLWRGQYSLASAFRGFFILGYFVALVVGMFVTGLFFLILPVAAPLMFWLVSRVYEIIAGVGVWRSSNALIKDKGGRLSLTSADSAKILAAKVVVVVAVLWSVGIPLLFLASGRLYLRR
jgi:hypothetical protein